MWKTSRVITSFTFLLLALAAVQSKAQPDLDDLRDQLSRDVSNSSVGAGYAQLLNFFIEPDISASILEADDTEYDVFKVPLQYERDLTSDGWRLLLRATLSHASAETQFDFDPPFEPVDTEWEATRSTRAPMLMATLFYFPGS